jgi:hypothetical protein
MTNYIVAFVLATIIYLIAIRYLQELCPMSKFFKFVIYMCISTVALPAVNYIHPPASGEDDIISSLMSKVTNAESSVGADWQDAQKKANALVHGSSSQSSSESSESAADGIKTVTFANDPNLDNQSDDSNYEIIGRDGKVMSDS